jgi:Cof subfamily protein (haloacid dehalogenase superfamily)
MVAVDLDGTLLRSDGSISPRTRRALDLMETARIAVVAVTARPPRRMRQITQAVGLHGIAVCGNGALLYDLSSETLVRQDCLDEEIARQLVSSLRDELPGVCFAVEAGLRYGCEESYFVTRSHEYNLTDPAMTLDDAIILCSLGVTKLIVQHHDHPIPALVEMTERHVGSMGTVTHSGFAAVEIAAAGVTKAAALKAICERAGISREAVMAFGDMPNDLPMLEWAGQGVAVANADAAVLAKADEVTLSNDEDGVAVVLERIAEGR